MQRERFELLRVREEPGRVGDEGLLLEVLEAQALARRRGVLRGQHDVRPHDPDRLARDRARQLGEVVDRRVDLAAQQRIDGGLERFDEVHVHLGVALLQATDPSGQQLAQEHPRRGDAEFAGDLVARQRPQHAR